MSQADDERRIRAFQIQFREPQFASDDVDDAEPSPAVARRVRSDDALRDVDTVQKGTRPLAEIHEDDTNKIVIELDLHGQGVLIDGRMVLSYTVDRTKPQFQELMITRERTEPIIIPKSSTDVCTPYLDEEERRGTFDGTLIGLRSKRPVIYVGEDYALKLINKSQDRISFELSSTHPIVRTEFDRTLDPVRVLSTIWRTRNPRRQ